MTSRVHLQILALQLSLVIAQPCPEGYQTKRGQKGCHDIDECHRGEEEDYSASICGDNENCTNTVGSFYCTCIDGFRTQNNFINFTASSTELCQDINECGETEDLCGNSATCYNTVGTFICICHDGYVSSNGKETFNSANVTCEDRNECRDDKEICGLHAYCINVNGGYRCVCHPGYRLRSGEMFSIGNAGSCESFTNYGNKQSRCTDFNCDVFSNHSQQEILPGLQELLSMRNSSCVGLCESETPVEIDTEALLERLLSLIDRLLSGGPLNENRKVSALLDIVENTMRFISPGLKKSPTKKSYNHTEVEILVHWDAVIPQGTLILSHEHVQLESLWETAAGDTSTYPGFATMSLLSYKGLENSTNGYFGGVTPREGQRFQINSKVVTATVSNRHTDSLDKPVRFTFDHLAESAAGNHICVYWDFSVDNGGGWSDRGCTVVESNANHTLCSCTHLSSFAVLLALYEFEEPFALQFITWVGLSLSQLCLLISILTFSLCRSIQSTRNTIHLHLCVSLFIANLVFLAGISSTGNQAGCAVVAGLLHFFFLASFCWMCQEGVQLFRMVVLVFNTTTRPVYLMAAGYGVPALIVTLSAIINARGYGTKRHCWLSLERGFIWSFFGPICLIILVNIFFFLITVWKLAQKFSSLNPDLNSLRKIKAFTITAVAQLCILGTMWIFGCFQFKEGTLAMSYLFAVFNSLQGVLIFIMHCLLPKQVREEYGRLLSNLCKPQKKRYTEFSYNQSTSKSQTSRSGQNTGESQI